MGLWPLMSWLAGPVACLYLGKDIMSGLYSMTMSGIMLAGLYGVLEFTQQLPPYLDVNYPVFHAHPALLELVMLAPLAAPWSYFGKLFAVAGAVFSAWSLVRQMLHSWQQPGEVARQTV